MPLHHSDTSTHNDTSTFMEHCTVEISGNVARVDFQKTNETGDSGVLCTSDTQESHSLTMSLLESGEHNTSCNDSGCSNITDLNEDHSSAQEHSLTVEQTFIRTHCIHSAISCQSLQSFGLEDRFCDDDHMTNTCDTSHNMPHTTIEHDIADEFSEHTGNNREDCSVAIDTHHEDTVHLNFMNETESNEESPVSPADHEGVSLPTDSSVAQCPTITAGYLPHEMFSDGGFIKLPSTSSTSVSFDLNHFQDVSFDFHHCQDVSFNAHNCGEICFNKHDDCGHFPANSADDGASAAVEHWEQNGDLFNPGQQQWNLPANMYSGIGVPFGAQVVTRSNTLSGYVQEFVGWQKSAFVK